MAQSAFAASLKLLAFRYTPWGATGAADGAGAGAGRGARGTRGGPGEPRSRSSPISHPPNFIFGNPGQPRSLKMIIIKNAGIILEGKKRYLTAGYFFD